MGVKGDRVWTAEDLEKLTPSEQDALFESSIVTDLADVPAQLLEKVRSRVRERIGHNDLPGN